MRTVCPISIYELFFCSFFNSRVRSVRAYEQPAALGAASTCACHLRVQVRSCTRPERPLTPGALCEARGTCTHNGVPDWIRACALASHASPDPRSGGAPRQSAAAGAGHTAAFGGPGHLAHQITLARSHAVTLRRRDLPAYACVAGITSDDERARRPRTCTSGVFPRTTPTSFPSWAGGNGPRQGK